MPQLISIASKAPTTIDTLVASPFDLGNIQDAFMYYHYGVGEKNQDPSEISIHGKLKEIKNGLFSASASSVELLETYNFTLESSGSLKIINDLDVFEKLQNVRKQIYALFEVKNESYTLRLPDNRRFIVIDSSSFTTVFIPNDNEVNFPIGTTIDFINIGTSFLIIRGQDGVQVRGEKNTLTKDVASTIYKRSVNDWVLVQ
jgi:phage tail tube protein FII